MDKLKLAFTFLIMISVIVIFLYWLSNKAEKDKINRVEYIEKNYKYSKGVIVKKYSYKGHSLKVRYKIGNVYYEYSGGWDYNPRNIDVGDSIWFKYAIDNPRLIITELENSY